MAVQLLPDQLWNKIAEEKGTFRRFSFPLTAPAGAASVSGMPRTGRIVSAGMIYHVLNRSNARQTLFHKPADYEVLSGQTECLSHC